MDVDETSENAEGVRRTRSGRAVKPASAPAPKQTRKTRKKIFVEVEVSDEEDILEDEPTTVEFENSDNAVEAVDSIEETLENSKDMNSEHNTDFTSFQDTEPDNSSNNYEQNINLAFDDNLEQPAFEDETTIDDNDTKIEDVKEESECFDNGDDDQMSSRNSINENSENSETKNNDFDEKMMVENDSPEDNTKIDENHSIKPESDDEEENSQNLLMDESKVDEDFEMKIEEDESKMSDSADPDTEVISEDELPTVQVVKVPETEEVSDEELPGPKRAELPADTEVVSEDELPTVKKEGGKRKLAEGEYDPGSPTSENEIPAKKQALAGEETEDVDESAKKDGEKVSSVTSAATTPKKQVEAPPRKLPELDKYWKAVNDDPTDFTGWTYLLQYVDQENDMEAAREAYDAFLSHYPYCYGYWRKYADYEKRKGNKKKCEEVFERGLKAIPLSVDLWIHYLTYTRSVHPDDETYLRSQFERALTACGLEFRSDRLWDGYIKWEAEAKRLQNVTRIYDRLLATPTQGYTNHFDNFQEHVASNVPNKILEVDEFLALRKEVKHMLKHDITTEPKTAESSVPDVPPGDEPDSGEAQSSDEETNAIRERIVSIRRKIHKNTVNAVTARWNFEEGIKRPYFHVKPLERCQLKNWKEYLDYEIEQADQSRIIILFERCLIACALYEEFWLRFVHYLEGLKDEKVQPRIRDVYERACTIHHLKKPNLHLQWAMFEESVGNFQRAGEILVNLEKSVPNLLQVAYRRINLERRRGDSEKCSQLYEHYITSTKNKLIATNLSIKYARFCLKVCNNMEKSLEILNSAVAKDTNNPRLYLQLIDLQLQRDGVSEEEVIKYIDAFLEKDNVETEQKVLFAQRKLEFLEDFGTDIHSVQKAYDEYQKYCKLNKDNKKKKDEGKPNEPAATGTKKEKNPPLPSGPSSSYGNYSSYGNSNSNASTGSYPQYSGSQTQGQYGTQYGTSYGQGTDYQQYQNWQYPPSGYGGYNQWSGYSSGYY